jgi:hypothetical protein
LVEVEGREVGGRGGHHDASRGLEAVEAVQKRSGDSTAMRTGVDHEPADVQGGVSEPVPGQRSGQPEFVIESEEGLTTVA